MSGNHNSSLDRAISLVDIAAESGVDAVKLQTYKADLLTINSEHEDFIVKGGGDDWAGQTLYEIYSKGYTPWEWHEEIIDRAKKRGLLCFSSPFDETAVDFLENLNVPLYKIASPEIIDHELIMRVAQTKKPIIISTGMASLREIDEAVNICRDNGNSNIILLQCTSSYPASPENSNINTLINLRKTFNCEVGLSDHTMGLGVSIAAIALGAVVIEKHFTSSRSDGGVDSVFSLEPDELKQLVIETKRAWLGLGSVTYGPNEEEQLSYMHRRSLYVCENIKKGEVFTKRNIRSIRPGYGIKPKYLSIVLGRKAKSDILKGTPLNFDMF